jgi:hypothetical protein
VTGIFGVLSEVDLHPVDAPGELVAADVVEQDHEHARRSGHSGASCL